MLNYRGRCRVALLARLPVIGEIGAGVPFSVVGAMVRTSASDWRERKKLGTGGGDPAQHDRRGGDGDRRNQPVTNSNRPAVDTGI